MSIDIRKIPVYYISLPGSNADRIGRMLSDAGFKDVRMSPGVFEKNKTVGVAMAHIVALEAALSECEGPFIILEDDVEIMFKDMEIFTPDYVDAIYLGISMWGLRNGHGELNMICHERSNGGLYRLYNMLSAHAVLYINHDYAQFLLENIPMFVKMQTNQDKLRAESMKYWNIYAINNPIFYQKGKYEKYTKFRLNGQRSVDMSVYYK